jgi:hypothetical protein
MHQLRIFYLLTAVAVLFLGCNPEGLPKLGRVAGTITMDGQAVPNANVIFEGAQAGETASLGKTDSTGNFELYYSRGHKGATIGDHKVVITTFQPADDDNPKGIRETVPARYNAKTELTAKVTGGQNKVNFDLKSGGEIIQPDEQPAPKKGKKGK